MPANMSVCVCVRMCLYTSVYVYIYLCCMYVCMRQICRLKCRLHTAKRLRTHSHTYTHTHNQIHVTHCKLTFVKCILRCFPLSALKRKAPSLEFLMQTIRELVQVVPPNSSLT